MNPGCLVEKVSCSPAEGEPFLVLMLTQEGQTRSYALNDEQSLELAESIAELITEGYFPEPEAETVAAAEGGGSVTDGGAAPHPVQRWLSGASKKRRK
jgi:hypothetical protein